MVFSITRYTFTTRNHWLLNCIAKKHSLSAPEKRTPGACRTESAVLDWITKPFYVFPLRIQLIFRTQFRGIRAFYKRKGPAGEVGNSSYTKPSVFHSNFPECRLHSVWTKSCLLACNLNSVRIVHYQIFLMCISRPLFRCRSCLMFMVPSRYFLSRWRAEIVSHEVSNGMYSS